MVRTKVKERWPLQPSCPPGMHAMMPPKKAPTRTTHVLQDQQNLNPVEIPTWSKAKSRSRKPSASNEPHSELLKRNLDQVRGRLTAAKDEEPKLQDDYNWSVMVPLTEKLQAGNYF